jgi:CheY-like chemotaxis protein
MSVPPRKILVVEDNSDFLQTVCDMLSALGHDVKGVASAEEAAGLLASGSFGTLFTDINLPGMSGIELAQLAVRTVPGIRIIFSSGYGYLLSDDLGFDFLMLHKPYFLSQLEDVLGSPQQDPGA